MRRLSVAGRRCCWAAFAAVHAALRLPARALVEQARDLKQRARIQRGRSQAAIFTGVAALSALVAVGIVALAASQVFPQPMSIALAVLKALMPWCSSTLVRCGYHSTEFCHRARSVILFHRSGFEIARLKDMWLEYSYRRRPCSVGRTRCAWGGKV